MKPIFKIITHFLKITFPNLWQVLGAEHVFLSGFYRNLSTYASWKE